MQCVWIFFLKNVWGSMWKRSVVFKQGCMGEHVEQCDVASQVGATLFRFKTRGFDRILCLSVCVSLSHSLSLSLSFSLSLTLSLSLKTFLLTHWITPSPSLPVSLSPYVLISVSYHHNQVIMLEYRNAVVVYTILMSTMCLNLSREKGRLV